MWYCSNCGCKNEGRFCTSCGNAQAPEETVENQAFAKEKESITPPPKNKGLIIGIVIAAVVILVGGLFAGHFLNREASTEKAETTGVYYYASPENGSYAALYAEATTESEELTRLGVGETVELVRSAGENFLYVYEENRDLYGYIRIKDVESSYEDAVASAEKVLGTYYVTGVTESLALKESPDVNANVIKNLNNGTAVSLLEMTDDEYWYVKDENDKYGYVLKNYLTADIDKIDYNNSSAKASTSSSSSKEIIATYYVSGTKNYLAIRSQASASANVEIGKTYNGNKVGVIEKTNGTFWYIYDYSSGLYGYVKCAYISQTAPVVSDGSYYYVSGTKHYLALRSEPKDGSQYEIAKLYNGDAVKVLEKTDNTFWYVCDESGTVYGYVKCAYLVK